MCREIWRALQSTGSVVSSMWQWVYGPWQQCSAQRCVWWCLCCNKWICWIALILLAVLLVVFLILYVVWVFMLLITCESLCILITLLQAPSRNISVHCFQYWDPPPAPSGGSGSGSGSGALTSPPTGTGTGIGLGTGGGTGTGTTTIAHTTGDAGRLALARAGGDQAIATCGCSEGRIGLVLGLGLFVLVLASDPRLIHMTGWPAPVVAVGIAVVGALAGKTIGQLRARWILRRSAPLGGMPLRVE